MDYSSTPSTGYVPCQSADLPVWPRAAVFSFLVAAAVEGATVVPAAVMRRPHTLPSSFSAPQWRLVGPQPNTTRCSLVEDPSPMHLAARRVKMPGTWTPRSREADGWWGHAPPVLGIGAWLVVAVIAVFLGHRAADTVGAGGDLQQVIVAGQALRSGQALYQVHPAAQNPNSCTRQQLGYWELRPHTFDFTR